MKKTPNTPEPRLSLHTRTDLPATLVSEYITALLASEYFAPLITCHRIEHEKEADFSLPTRPWAKAMSDVITHAGISHLYTHQATAIDAVRGGKSVVVATPTASGKSLIYNLPVIEKYLADPDAKSLFLFPLKALAQDQLTSFKKLTAHWPVDSQPKAFVYDGDTTPHFRKKIRNTLPSVLFTNPEMLHLAILPHHHLWASLFAGLTYIVVDEVHTYRGLMGAHMAHVFTRLRRIASLYGASPTFICCSATVANPAELTKKLTGETPVTVRESAAPRGKRHFLFINPQDSPSSAAIHLLKAALVKGLRTIVYCQSRRMTELISLWASQEAKSYANRISAYRAGYLPEERRDIEARMASGSLLAVISTSALELGIDIGGLDICILVGYPGTVMAMMQRGGRVGRSMSESAVILVAQEDALDQYIIRHPEDFFSRPPETAILNPHNPVILSRHLECAAAELPLRLDREHDVAWLKDGAMAVVQSLESQGRLLRSADGFELFAANKSPQRHVSLRGASNTVTITDGNNAIIGSIDGIRALREAHPGAIYLHRGRYYEITDLDIPGGTANARPCKPVWYTRPRSTKDTEILSIEESTIIGSIPVQFGRLKVTDIVTGYEKRSTQSGQLLGVVPLNFPPQIFETEGFWFLIPQKAQAKVEQAYMHFMGAIHALEHAAIGILPFLIMTDRNDLGGISKPMHLQTEKPTVFIYDGIPGGAGLSRAAFALVHEMFIRVTQVIGECSCELGCPSCVQSPKCGSGNRPIDKIGAQYLLQTMLQKDSHSIAEAEKAIATPLIPLASVHEHSKKQQLPAVSWDTILGAPLEKPVPLLENFENMHHSDTHAEAAAAMYASLAVSRDTSKDNQLLSSLPIRDNTSTRSEKNKGFSMIKNTGFQEPLPDNFAVFDVETRYSSQEVGGWNKAHLMGVSIVVVYYSLTDSFISYTQEAVPRMVEELKKTPLVIGFNTLRFDYSVLAPHAPGFSFSSLPSLDILTEVHAQLSYRVSLDNLTTATLGAQKSADGLQALTWWKEGRLDLIEEYCQKDVLLTRDLFLFGKDNGFLLFTNKAGKQVRVPASWGQASSDK